MHLMVYSTVMEKTVSGLKITKINNGTIRTTGLFGS